MEERYDLAIIGAGTAGFAAAGTARAAGKRVVLVTGLGALGGTCILRGCMPAKTLLSATERLGEVQRAPDVGVEAQAVRVDLPAIVARKRELIEYFREDRIADLEAYPLVRGAARFTSESAIDVAGRQIEAERFIIATGSHIVAPDIAGFADAGYITSDDVLELKTIPESVAIVGGGPVGCEFAQYFARLGAHVILVQAESELLRNEDPHIGAAVREALAHEGIEVILDATIDRLEHAAAQKTLYFTVDGAAQSRGVATILLASGRVPNIVGLELERAGIRASASGIHVDAFLRTSNPNVYAAGDVIGRRCLVHVAEYAGKLAARNAFAQRAETADLERFEAHAVYTQPQVAVAGMTERVARERGIDVRSARHEFSDVGKALVSDQARGFVTMLATPDDRIVGVSIFGADAIDLLGEAIVAIDRGLRADELAALPHLHPTMSEILARVAEDLIETSPKHAA